MIKLSEEIEVEIDDYMGITVNDNNGPGITSTTTVEAHLLYAILEKLEEINQVLNK